MARGSSDTGAQRRLSALWSVGSMLAKDVRFEGWTTEDWSRLLSLWKSPATPRARPRVSAPPVGCWSSIQGASFASCSIPRAVASKRPANAGLRRCPIRRTSPRTLGGRRARGQSRTTGRALRGAHPARGRHRRSGPVASRHLPRTRAEGMVEIWPNRIDRSHSLSRSPVR